MKTRVPKTKPPEVKKSVDSERTEQVRHYRLITPLFGGGVEPNRADPITVVRGTEVRGHLRFWWRATCGGRFGDNLDAMRKAEEAIWGSASAKGKPGPSEVTLSLEVLNRGKPLNLTDKRGKVVRNIGDIKSPYSYVAFPLRDDETNPAVLVDVEFELTLRYLSKWESDVQDALWAWETFGGLGARTRRGCGALQLLSTEGEKERLPTCDQAAEQLRASLRKHVVEGVWPTSVPHLTRDASFVVVSTPRSKESAIEAWRYLIERFKSFRQARYPDRKGLPYGRSKWPEPDEVRRLTGTHAPKHPPRHPVHKFPRGQFGLPIIFHFKDEDQGDPPQTTLQGAAHDRFASALILRPLACADGVVGLAFRLDSPKSPPGGYVLKPKDQAQSHPVRIRLSSSEAAQIEPLGGESDVLQAFLNFLENKRSIR